MNGFSKPNHLDESTFIFSCFFFISFFDEYQVANRIAKDGAPRLAASNLGLFCLPMSNKRMSGLTTLVIMIRGSHCMSSIISAKKYK